jgi:hypothetical protein
VRNQTPKEAQYTIEVNEPAGAEVKIVGVSPITIPPKEMNRTEAWIVVPPSALQAGSVSSTIRVQFADGTEYTKVFPLLGPNSKP